MGELARRRSARDLWISRSHLWAIGAAALCACALSFAAGYRLGHGERGPLVDVPSAGARTDDSLVELLARVEAGAEPDGGVKRLTFPDALAGQSGDVPVPPPPIADAAPRALVTSAPRDVAPVADPAPDGRFTVEVGRFELAEQAVSLRDHLRARDAQAWIGVEQLDGRRVHRVAVGGFPTEAAARAGVAEVQALLEGGEAVVRPIE